jgi:glycosyltransferase involved in cell wall biosynthesis
MENRKLRIAMISEHGDPLAPLGGQQSGGQNVFVYELSRALSRLGVKVDVFTRWDNRKADQMVKFAERARVVRLKAGPRHFISKDKFGPLMPEFVEHFLEYNRTKRVKYNFIHSHYYWSGWAGMQIKNILHIPLIHTFHSLGLIKKKALGDSDTSPDERTRIEEKLLQVSDSIIVTSPQEKLAIIQDYASTSDKIVVIPAGVNLNRFSPMEKDKVREKMGLPKHKKIIVFAGTMQKNKGGEVLIKAVKVIKTRWPKFFEDLEVLMFSGDPRKDRKKEKRELGLRSHLRKLIKTNELGDKIKLSHGIDQEKLHYYFAAADMVVVPSYYESFGLVAIEAMASGAPVIASDVGGLKWTIEDDITGYHAKPGDHIDFARKITKILKDDRLQDRLSQNAAIHVKNSYDWDVLAVKYLEEYKSLIKE